MDNNTLNGGSMPTMDCPKCGERLYGWSLKYGTVCPTCSEPVKEATLEELWKECQDASERTKKTLEALEDAQRELFKALDRLKGG